MITIDLDAPAVRRTFSDTWGDVVEVKQPRGLVYLPMITMLRQSGSAILICPSFSESEAGYVQKGVFYGLWPSGYAKCLEAMNDFVAIHLGVPQGIDDMPPFSARRIRVRLDGNTHDAVMVLQKTRRGPVMQMLMPSDPDFGFYLDLSQALKRA